MREILFFFSLLQSVLFFAWLLGFPIASAMIVLHYCGVPGRAVLAVGVAGSALVALLGLALSRFDYTFEGGAIFVIGLCFSVLCVGVRRKQIHN